MTDHDEALAAVPPTTESAVSLVPGRHVHAWSICPCGAQRDLAAPRRGRSADRLGKDQERRIERLYGPRKVGEFGDAVDLIGRDFVWQSKATRSDPPAWLAAVDWPQVGGIPAIVTRSAAAMEPLRAHRSSLVVTCYVKQGKRPVDRIWVRAADWAAMHGIAPGWLPGGWLVMSGESFLAIHGRDEEKTA